MQNAFYNFFSLKILCFAYILTVKFFELPENGIATQQTESDAHTQKKICIKMQIDGEILIKSRREREAVC